MLTALLISLFIGLSICCDTSYNFPYSSCSLNLTYLDDSCSSFNLVNCTWYECALHTYVDNFITCVDYQIHHTSDWGNCIQSCCNSGTSYSQNSDGISQCSTYITVQSHIKLIILGAILLLFLLFFAIIFTADILKRRRSLAVLEQRIQMQDCLSEENKWKKHIFGYHTLSKESLCNICYKKGAFCLVGCFHVFHRDCIMPVLKNQNKCSLCKGINVSKITIYCVRCYKFYLEYSISNLNQLQAKIELICQECGSQDAL